MRVGRPVTGVEDVPVPFESLPNYNEASITRRSGSSTRSFSEWIENEPKEKWDLLYDTNRSRYNIMIINLAEVYNWVMKGFRGLPLVEVVDFII